MMQTSASLMINCARWSKDRALPVPVPSSRRQE